MLLLFTGFGGSKNTTPPPPRGAAKNLKLEAAFNKHGGPLPLYFDYKSKTWQSIGDYGSMYKSLLGSLIGSVPQYYDSWDDVPEATRENILAEIQVRICLFFYFYYLICFTMINPKR
jgi:hypothetical protein